jgi:hypothetical protein
MSYDCTCQKCGRHLYAFCNDVPKEGEHIGWILLNDVIPGDNAWCVECLQNRLKETESRLTVARRESAEALIEYMITRLPRYVSGQPDALRALLVEFRAALAAKEK